MSVGAPRQFTMASTGGNHRLCMIFSENRCTLLRIMRLLARQHQPRSVDAKIRVQNTLYLVLGA
jgi:hypothetical protein